MNVNSMIINKFQEFLIRLDLFNFGSSQPDARLCADFAERKSDAGVGSPPLSVDERRPMMIKEKHD